MEGGAIAVGERGCQGNPGRESVKSSFKCLIIKALD